MLYICTYIIYMYIYYICIYILYIYIYIYISLQYGFRSQKSAKLSV